MKKLLGLCLCMAFLCIPVQAAQTNESPLTHGNVQRFIRKGVTTQSEVLERFGSPNITTIDGEGNEVWTYQAHASEGQSSAKNVYGTVALAGAAKRTIGFSQSSKTMTLIY
ncbi:MAG TPA: hypothetical protein V6C99_08115 [Oculatellaceae cyanobacterium]|jgi:hypothetical protein